MNYLYVIERIIINELYTLRFIDFPFESIRDKDVLTLDNRAKEFLDSLIFKLKQSGKDIPLPTSIYDFEDNYSFIHIGCCTTEGVSSL